MRYQKPEIVLLGTSSELILGKRTSLVLKRYLRLLDALAPTAILMTDLKTVRNS